MRTTSEINTMLAHYTEVSKTATDRFTKLEADTVVKTINWWLNPTHHDPIVQEVCDQFQTRSRLGIRKYGTTLFANDAAFEEWIEHLQEELMDATLYIQKLKSKEICK